VAYRRRNLNLRPHVFGADLPAQFAENRLAIGQEIPRWIVYQIAGVPIYEKIFLFNAKSKARFA
jgi:hypothetical protein